MAYSFYEIFGTHFRSYFRELKGYNAFQFINANCTSNQSYKSGTSGHELSFGSKAFFPDIKS